MITVTMNVSTALLLLLLVSALAIGYFNSLLVSLPALRNQAQKSDDALSESDQREQSLRALWVARMLFVLQLLNLVVSILLVVVALASSIGIFPHVQWDVTIPR